MKLQQPHRREAFAQPLLPQPYGLLETEQEKLLAIYCSLPALERADRFISTARVAKRYGVPQRTVQHWIDYGWIVAVKVGRKYKVDLHSVNEHLRHCTRQMN